MLRRVMSGLLALAVCAGSVAGQESASTTSILERLAVQAAVDSAVGSLGPSVRIVISPMIVFANEAPGGRDSALRDAERSDYLARALRARILPGKAVMDCTARPCKLRGADVFVTLSEPAIVGAKASVTVTTLQQAKRRLHYRTVNVRLAGQGSVWRVVGLEELGVS